MLLSEQITVGLKDAMKAGDETRKITLSLLKARIHNTEIERGKQETGLTDDEVTEIILSEAKRRAEAAFEFTKAGREDLAAKEMAEKTVLEKYLPPQLSGEEVRAELEALLNELGTHSREDFGMIMGKAMALLKGRADGGVVREELERLLE